MTADATMMLPLGQFFGAFHPAAGSADRVFNVRVGAEVHELDELRYVAWALLHGIPDRLAGRVWGRPAMRDAAPGADLEPVLDALVARGLAVEVPAGAAAAVGFARRHRMGHRMLGLGNSAEQPWLFSIGFPDRPVIRVTRQVFDVWDSCELADTLWEACVAVARADTEPADAEPADGEPADTTPADAEPADAEPAGVTTGATDLAHGFLGSVHHLLSMSVVYLEPGR